jgi:molybdate transport repressor ModE-like protein
LVAPIVDISQIALRQLQFLVAFAEEGTYARAAARLGVAMPNLWKQVQRLEDILGVKLIEPQRRGASPRLTPIGNEVVEQARLLLDRGSQLLATVQHGLDDTGLPLRTAGFPAHCSLVLSEMTARLRKHDVPADVPDTSEDYRLDGGRRLLNDVARGGIDLVVAPSHDDHDSVVLTAERLYSWNLVAVVDGFRLKLAADELCLNDLVDKEIALSPPDHMSHSRLMDAARKAGLVLRIGAMTDSVEAMLAHGRAGLAIPVLPADALASFPNVRRVVPLVDLDGERLSESHYLYYRKADEEDERTHLAVRLAHEIVAERALTGLEVPRLDRRRR